MHDLTFAAAARHGRSARDPARTRRASAATSGAFPYPIHQGRPKGALPNSAWFTRPRQRVVRADRPRMPAAQTSSESSRETRDLSRSWYTPTAAVARVAARARAAMPSAILFKTARSGSSWYSSLIGSLLVPPKTPYGAAIEERLVTFIDPWAFLLKNARHNVTRRVPVTEKGYVRKGHIHALVAEDESIGDLGASATPGWIAHELFHAQDASQAAKEAKRFVPPQRMERVAASLLRRGFVLTLNAKNTPCVNYSNVCDAAPGAVVLLHRRCNVVKHAMSYSRRRMVTLGCGGAELKLKSGLNEGSSINAAKRRRDKRVGWRPGMKGRATRNVTGYVIPRALPPPPPPPPPVGLANCSASKLRVHIPHLKNILVCTFTRQRLADLAARSTRQPVHVTTYEGMQRDGGAAAREEVRTLLGLAPPTAAERNAEAGHDVRKTSSDDLRTVLENYDEVEAWLAANGTACLLENLRDRGGGACKRCPNPWPDVPCRRRGFRGLADLSGTVCEGGGTYAERLRDA